MRFIILSFLHLNLLLINCQQPQYKILEEVIVPPTLNDDGSQFYNFRFRTSNDIEREENGYASSDEKVGLYLSGSYSYIRPDGIKEIVKYIADKDGFRILPKNLPPQPQYIPPPALASLAG